MKTLYARREATTDETWIQHGPANPVKKDLVLYEDSDRMVEKARIPWYQGQARARKWVMLNCSRRQITFK